MCVRSEVKKQTFGSWETFLVRKRHSSECKVVAMERSTDILNITIVSSFQTILQLSKKKKKAKKQSSSHCEAEPFLELRAFVNKCKNKAEVVTISS